MKLILETQRLKLEANWTTTQEAAARGSQIDTAPMVKLFCPWTAATWLISEAKPGEPDVLFGLCDLGMGCPEIGYVFLSEMKAITGPGGLRIERDIHFTALASLAVYAEAARQAQQIVQDRQALMDAHERLARGAKDEGTRSIGFLLFEQES